MLAVTLALASSASAIEIRKVTSSKGVTAWLSEDHTIPLIAVRLSFEGGSAADPAGLEGLATFLSGMLDEGAGDLSSAQFQKRIDELNMRMSFSADRDSFSGSLQTLTDNRDAAFDMLRLALTAPRFDQEPLDRVRQQILLSLREDKEDPESIAGAHWMKTMFGDHPYARPVKGTAEGLKAVTGSDLKALADRLFARQGLVISVVGDIDEDTLTLLLDQTFANLPETSTMPEIPAANVTQGPIVNIVERDIPQSVVRFGHAGISRDDPDFLTAYVLNHILGGSSFGSRLMDEVREKRGLSYSTYSVLYPLKGGDLFFGGAATVNERVPETVSVVLEVLRRLAEEGPSEQELSEAKTYLTGSYALRFDNSRKIASQLQGIQRQRLGIDYVIKRNDLVNAVTIEDIRRVARRLIKADALVFTVVGKPVGLDKYKTGG